MRLTIPIAIFLSLGFFIPTPALATDACKTVLCLYGRITSNNGGQECRDAERDFFNIVKITRHGFHPARTADARKNFLIECKAANPEIINQIIRQFGQRRSG